MKSIKLSTFIKNMAYYVKKAHEGAIFVYPTDSIYGIGGIATQEVTNKINKIKQRSGKHFSIIAPDYNRVEEKFDVGKGFGNTWEKNFNQFCIQDSVKRGLTMILPLKENQSFPRTNYPENGVRIIYHPIQEFVKLLGECFISTSANISGHPNISHPDLLTDKQKNEIDFIIDDGEICGEESIILDYVSGDIFRK